MPSRCRLRPGRSASSPARRSSRLSRRAATTTALRGVGLELAGGGDAARGATRGGSVCDRRLAGHGSRPPEASPARAHICPLHFTAQVRYRARHGSSESGRAQLASQSCPSARRARQCRFAGHHELGAARGPRLYGRVGELPDPPSERDLYHALHAHTPASHWKALVSMWVKDAKAAPGRDEWL